jgi:hypothetical protein
MAKEIEEAIRSKKRSTRSVNDQVAIAHAMWEKDVGPDHDGLKANEIESELGLSLDYGVRTSLSHVEEIDIVEEFLPPGPETLVIAEWMDDGDGEVVLGRVSEAAEEGLDALANDVESIPAETEPPTATDGGGITLRSVLASEFDLKPKKIEDYLRRTDKPVDVLNRAVEAIKDADGVEIADDYGEIVFINMPYRYRLTEKAVRMYGE